MNTQNRLLKRLIFVAENKIYMSVFYILYKNRKVNLIKNHAYINNIIRRARKELNYSDKTPDLAIIQPLIRSYEKYLKIKKS